MIITELKAKYAENLVEAGHYLLESKGYSVSGESQHAALTLYYKALMLLKNSVRLITDDQHQSSAYLARGLVECLADMHFLLNTDEGQKKIGRFNSSFREILAAQIKYGSKEKLDLSRAIWSNEPGPTQRVNLLSDQPYLADAYAYLSCFAHSSAAGVGVIELKDEKRTLEIQLMVACNCFLEVAQLFASQTGKATDTIDELYRDFFPTFTLE